MKSEVLLKLLVATTVVGSLSACNKSDKEPTPMVTTTTLHAAPQPQSNNNNDEKIEPPSTPAPGRSDENKRTPGTRTAPKPAQPKPEDKGSGSGGSGSGSKSAPGSTSQRPPLLEKKQKPVVPEVIYSGTAPDDLRAREEKEVEEANDTVIKEASKKFAKSIREVHYAIDMGKVPNNVVIKVYIENGKKTDVVTLTGHIQPGSRRIEEIVIEDELTTLPNAALHTGSNETFFECMDEAERQCQTALFHLELGTKGSPKSQAPVARMILRQSSVKVSSEMLDEYSKSPSINNLFAFYQDLNKKYTALHTFEVIGGMSGFRFLSVSNSGQVLTFRGLLKDPAFYESAQDVAYPLLNEEELSEAFNSIRSGNFIQELKFDVMRSLRNGVSIVGNDGEGNITTHLHVKDKDGREDTVKMTIERRIGAIRK